MVRAHHRAPSIIQPPNKPVDVKLSEDRAVYCYSANHTQYLFLSSVLTEYCDISHIWCRLSINFEIFFFLLYCTVKRKEKGILMGDSAGLEVVQFRK